MKTRKIGGGTSFNITVPLDEEITSYENVLAAFYTDKNRAVKFSYLEKEGFEKLDIGSSTSELVGLLTADQTAKMSGYLFMEMKFIKTTDPEDAGNSVPTNVLDENGACVYIDNTVLGKIS